MPPGYTHDEFGDLDVAAQVSQGDWQLIYTGGYALDGSEPGYFPALAASQAIWGAGPLGRRLPAVFAGTLGLACLYVLARRLFGWRVGLTTLGLASITWWSILLGRIVLREVFELPPYVLALYAGWRGLERVWQTGWSRAALRFFILGGVALGVSQYIHTIPRGLFLVFVLFGLYLLIFQRRLFRSAWRGLVVLIVVAEIVARRC